MKFSVAAVVLAVSLSSQIGAPVAHAQTSGSSELTASMLPIAAGGLVGAAAGFFVLPWVIPAAAVATTAGAPVTASPVFAAIGAGIGGLIGYEFVPKDSATR